MRYPRPATALLVTGLMSAAPSLAQERAPPGLAAIPYDSIVVPPATLLDWQDMVAHSSSIVSLDGLLMRRGATLGESFAGQTVARQTGSGGVPHDRVTGTPSAPLSAVAGAPGRNVAITPNDPLLGAPALLPTGPGGEDTNIHGEGSLAILFDEDQCLFGLRLFMDGTNGGAIALAEFGVVNITVFDRDGGLIAEIRRERHNGILRLAYRRSYSSGDIAGLLIQNVDPGGIAIEELRYDTACDPPLS